MNEEKEKRIITLRRDHVSVSDTVTDDNIDIVDDMILDIGQRIDVTVTDFLDVCEIKSCGADIQFWVNEMLSDSRKSERDNEESCRSFESVSNNESTCFTYSKFTKTSMIGENASYTSTFCGGGSLIHKDMVVTLVQCFDMSLIMKDTMTTTVYINATTTTNLEDTK